MSFPIISFWKSCDLSSVACPPPRGWMLDGWIVKVTLLISDCNCSSFVWIARFVSLGTAHAGYWVRTTGKMMVACLQLV